VWRAFGRLCIPIKERGKDEMSVRFCRITLTLALAWAIVLAPVAPAFGQTQDQTPPAAGTQAQTQAPAQPPAAPTPQIPARTIPMSSPDYTHGNRAFPNVLAPYSSPQVSEPNLTNSDRLHQMIKDGQIQLSLQDAIELALENNLDIAIQRYNPWIAETNILKAKGGADFSLGNIPSVTFDPLVTANTTISNDFIPVNNPFLTGSGLGLSAIAAHQTTMNFGYSQGFATGTNFSLTFDNTRQSSNSSANTFNPSIQSTLSVSFTQQLLNGFGILVNTRSIRISKLNKQISDAQFLQQVITSITAVQNAYWELAYARENVKVGEQSVVLAQQLYDDNKKQVEIGTMAPLDVVQAEANVATAQQTLINDQTLQLQDQTNLIYLITKNANDAAVLNAEIVPTDTLSPSLSQPVPTLDDAVRRALGERPDVRQAQFTVQEDEINVKSTRNALLPILELTGSYGTTGLAGNSTNITNTPTAFAPILSDPIVNAAGNPIPNEYVPTPIAFTTTSTSSASGINDAFDEFVHNEFPDYTLAISLQIPILNRQAQGDAARALLIKRQDETRLQQTDNGVLVAVRNALIAVVQGRAAVQAAQKTRDLDQQTLDAEEKKLKLGASTIFNVVTDQTTLASAASAEVRALANLVEAEVNLDAAMATTLDTNHITIASARTGVVPHDTLIPGTTPDGQILGFAPPAAPTASNISIAPSTGGRN
jgi:outer membrane protein